MKRHKYTDDDIRLFQVFLFVTDAMIRSLVAEKEESSRPPLTLPPTTTTWFSGPTISERSLRGSRCYVRCCPFTAIVRVHGKGVFDPPCCFSGRQEQGYRDHTRGSVMLMYNRGRDRDGLELRWGGGGHRKWIVEVELQHTY